MHLIYIILIINIVCTLVIGGYTYFQHIETIYNTILVVSLLTTGTTMLLLIIAHLRDRFKEPHLSGLEQRFKSAQENVHLLKTILDNINIAVWVHNANLDIIYFNKCYATITFSNAAGINSSTFEIDRYAKKNAMHALQQRITVQEERHIIIENKRCLYLFTDIFVPTDNIVVSIGYDISAKDKIEKELQLNIQAQSELLESTSTASAIFGPDRALKFFNQAFVKLWGLEEDFLISSPTYEIILDKLYSLRKLPEQANYLQYKRTQTSLFTNLTETLNDFLHLPDGRSLRVLVIPHALGGLLFSFEDMTDYITLQRSYNTLIQVQKTTLDNLHEGICVFGENGKLALINPKFMSMWKLSAEFLNSQPFISKLIDQYQRMFSSKQRFTQHRHQVLTKFTNRQPFEQQIEQKDNIFISRRVVPLPDGATLISDMDITYSIIVEKALIERNKALKEADRIKSEFLANVSYELRSPITSVMGYAEILNKQYVGSLNSKQHEYLNDIITATRALANLIDDIIDLTVLEAKKVELQLSEFNIIHSIQDTIGSIKPQLEMLKLECILRYDNIIGHSIVADESRFKQIMLKLLSNSMEYARSNSIIYLDVAQTPIEYIITIEDSGTSVLCTDQEFAFEKFYYTRNPKIGNKFGTWLGLSIVKKFVELHNGTVHFQSTSTGSKIACHFPFYNTMSLH